MAETAIWNFKQLAHHELDGFGGIGEGMSIQIAKDGRRILWLAHESAPKNFTAVDVSDPRAPKLVAPNNAFCVEGCERQYCGGASTWPPSSAAACQPQRGS